MAQDPNEKGSPTVASSRESNSHMTPFFNVLDWGDVRSAQKNSAKIVTQTFTNIQRPSKPTLC